MLRDVTFGQYYNADSFVHRMDSRAKILLSILYMVGVFFVKSYVVFAWLTAFLLIAIGASQVPLKSILKSLKGILFLLLFSSGIPGRDAGPPCQFRRSLDHGCAGNGTDQSAQHLSTVSFWEKGVKKNNFF